MTMNAAHTAVPASDVPPLEPLEPRPAVDRRRTFGEMSIGRFAALGGVTGFVLFVALGVSGSHSSMVDAILNGILPFLGAGSAAATLALARRGSPLVGSDDTVNQIEDKPLGDNAAT